MLIQRGKLKRRRGFWFVRHHKEKRKSSRYQKEIKEKIEVQIDYQECRHHQQNSRVILDNFFAPSMDKESKDKLIIKLLVITWTTPWSLEKVKERIIEYLWEYQLSKFHERTHPMLSRPPEQETENQLPDPKWESARFLGGVRHLQNKRA